MPTERRETPQDRYHKAHTVSIGFRLMKNTEQDIIQRLDGEPNKAGYIKGLIRADIAQERGEGGERRRMEIERKFLVRQLPEAYKDYSCIPIEQAYLCTGPVVRVRRSGEAFWMTYKGSGLLAREEYDLPLTEEAYRHLLDKADGDRIRKQRYCIPWQGRTIEVDLFEPPLAPLVMAEVEFSSEEEARAFQPPDWFGREVTYDPAYANSNLSKGVLPESLFQEAE